MRPRLVLTVLIIAEPFLLLIGFSPSVGLRVSRISAVQQWRQNPNPETEAAMRSEVAWDTWRPRIIWTLAAINPIFIRYAWRRCERMG
jgi:hypothetical protein